MTADRTTAMVANRKTGEITQEAPAAETRSLALHRPTAAPAVTMGAYLEQIATPEAIQQQKRFSALYDQACDALIGENDVQVEQGRTFKKKSAWRKLARYFQVSTEIIAREREWREAPGGEPYYYAEVTVRATAPWGQSMEATAACDTLEPRFRSPTARAKAGNDCLATAETRATNRAVSNLIAAGEVSAEEMEGGGGSGHGEVGGLQPECPVCGGAMWDNREGKKNPKAPDFKCKDRGCDGVFWPGQWPPAEESEVDRLAAGVRKMVGEIRALDTGAGAAAEVLAEDELQREDVTAEEIRTLGGKLLARLQRLQKQAKKSARAEAAELNAYLDRTIEDDDPDTPESIGAALADDDELPF